MRAPVQFDRYLDGLFSHPVRAMTSVLLLAGFFCIALGKLQFSMDYRDFFGGNDAHLEAYLKQQKTYSHNDSVLIAIEPARQEVFDFDLLKVIRAYTHQSWLLSGVTRVDSITNFQDSFAQDNALVIQDLVSDKVDFSQALLSYVKKISLNEPALRNRLVSGDGRYTGIALTVHLPEGPEKNIRIIEVVREVRALAKKLESEASVKKVYLSGTVMINNAFYEVSKHDLVTLMPIMFLVLVVFMTILLRSLSATTVVFTIVGLSVGVGFGAGVFAGIQLTPPSAAAAPIIMMLAIADCVHLLTTYYRRLEGGGYEDKLKAIRTSLRVNFVPVTLTTITTVIGFLTMNFSESPPFRDLGNIVAVGVIAAYVLTMVFLPLCLLRLPAKPASKTGFIEKRLALVAEWVIAKRKLLVGGTALMASMLFFFISSNELNDEFVKYFDESIEFRRDNDFITRKLTGIYQIEYSLTAATNGAISEPEYLQVLAAFASWFRKQANVVHVQSITDVYKKANMNLMDGRIEQYRIPETREIAAQALLAYEMSLPRGLDLNDQINVAKSATKFTVSLKTVSANELLALEQAAGDWLDANAPASMSHAIGTGPAVLFSHIGMRSILTGLIGGVVALVLICGLLSLVFRSARIGLISLLPNLFPAGMAFGLWGLLYGQINMALATVISMTLGIIVDDTIHFLSKYRLARIEGASPEEAVRRTYRTVGVAIIVTTIVLVAGFTVLTFSPFVMNWGMGLLSAITILFALFIDLILLPAFLIQFEKTKDEKTAVVVAGV